MIKSFGIPFVIIIIGLGMLPFMLFIGIPIAAVGVIWLIAAVIVEGKKKNTGRTA